MKKGMSDNVTAEADEDAARVIPFAPGSDKAVDVAALVDELELLLLFDGIESLSDKAVADELSARGLPLRADAAAYGPQAVTLAAVDHPLVTAPRVARDALVDQLEDLLWRKDIVVLSGSRGCGKTEVAHDLVMRANRASISTLFIDCFSMRMSSRALLSRAVLSLVEPGMAQGLDMAGADDPDFSRALHETFRTQLNSGAIVVFDNADRIANRPEPMQWLLDLLVVVRERGARVVLICRSGCSDERPSRSRNGYRDIACDLCAATGAARLSMGDLTLEELSAWLKSPYFADHRQEGMTAAELYAATGGRPRLIKDFCNWLACTHEIGANALRIFADRAGRTYCAECDRLIEALRQFPEWLTRPLAAPPALWPFLLETGAVRRTGSAIEFSAAAIARRYAWLTSTKNLHHLLGRGLEAILSNRSCPELAMAPLCAYSQSRTPREIFSAVARVLETIGLTEISLYAADRGNSKLWSRVYGHDAGDAGDRTAQPLEEEEWPDFTLSLRTGRPRVTARQRLLLPVFGESGRIEIVAEGTLTPVADPLRERARMRRLIGLADHIQPVLAVAVERLAHKRYMKLQRSRYYRALNSSEAHDVRSNLLLTAVQMMNCSAVAVLERGISAWVVSTLQTSEEDQWEDLLSGSTLNALNAIADHPSRRGLVLSGRELLVTFPRMRNVGDDVAVFIHPVWNRSVCRLIVFVFTGAASREIDGLKQMELSNTALYAVL